MASTLNGLSKTPKELECKYLYDEEGSQLFEKITQVSEYYPTVTEDSILSKVSSELANTFNEPVIIVELGSGSSIKTKRIIRAFMKRFGNLHYVPIDISYEILRDSCKSLSQEFNDLKITAIASEYVEGLEFVTNEFQSSPKFVLWLGSSVGNLKEEETIMFFKHVHKTLSSRDKMLVGMDLRKDLETLIRAYDDSEGVTAAFNKNLLLRINQDLGGSFDMNKFKHRAKWNGEKGRIEMHLESLVDQEVEIKKLGKTFSFAKGETIHTENSHKFSIEQIHKLSNRGGFNVQQQYFDEKKWFSLNVLAPM